MQNDNSRFPLLIVGNFSENLWKQSFQVWKFLEFVPSGLLYNTSHSRKYQDSLLCFEKLLMIYSKNFNKRAKTKSVAKSIFLLHTGAMWGSTLCSIMRIPGASVQIKLQINAICSLFFIQLLLLFVHDVDTTAIS